MIATFERAKRVAIDHRTARSTGLYGRRDQASPTSRTGHQTTAERGASCPCFPETTTGFSPQPLICRNRNFSAEPRSFLRLQEGYSCFGPPNAAGAEPVTGWEWNAGSALTAARGSIMLPEGPLIPTVISSRDATCTFTRLRCPSPTRRGFRMIAIKPLGEAALEQQQAAN